MNADELFLRQQRLLERSAQLRFGMVDVVQGLKKPLVIADGAKACLQWLYQNPLWPLGSLLILVILRPKRAISWGARAWWTWKMFKRAKLWVSGGLL